ncbi:hypothetical protein [Micromonospora zingiberis]|uniref:hypothetical protein n=1 Tax=Micromonospora zingiberis TaxID=2053011 RepID=UPI00197F766F|nr:hypothetical protein [Micromonospora zingiberis]
MISRRSAGSGIPWPADRLADARLVTITAGHLVHVTAPEAYLDAVNTFLAG